MKKILIALTIIVISNLAPVFADTISYDKTDFAEIKKFGRELFRNYLDEFGSEHAAVNRMKGIWFYLLQSFGDNPKNAKLIKKATNAAQLESAVMQLVN